MKTFKDYARLYDALYKDKNYQKECNWLEKVFKKYSSKKIKTILDLGCGTASHDLILAKKGYRLTGVDISSSMLAIARKKAKKANLSISFYKKDIRQFNLNKKFDAIISMFAVIGYQTTNDDFEKTLLRANKHLKKGGLFIFDCWFGPAVLADKPKNKIKKAKIKNGYILRETKCRFSLVSQVVDIFFKTKLYRKNRLIKPNKEVHQMRFFFPLEIEYFLQKTGFRLLKIVPFLKLSNKPTEKDWNIAIIARKK